MEVIGIGSAVAMSNLYQATAQALANAAHNATVAQQQGYIAAQAATTAGVNMLLSLGSASTGKAADKVMG